MRLPIRDRLEIFVQENRLYLFIFAVYALFICGIIAFTEYRLQQSEIEVGKIIAINAAYFLLALILLTIKMYINGWASRLFGGEIFTSSVSLVISVFLLIAFKLLLINYIELDIEWFWFIAFVSTLILLMPYIAFLTYVFILSKADWRH